MSVFKRKNKAGRPELPKDEKRTNWLHVGFTDKEFLKFQFAKGNLSQSEFARDLILRGVGYEVKK